MEITARDLRIGNYVMYAEDQVEFKVIGIDTEGLTVENESDKTWIETNTFEGIPLTEAWLKDFGFSVMGNNMNYFEFELEPYSKNEWFPLYKYTLPIAWCKFNRLTLSYVHELQNLYYALTQTELTLTK